MSETEEQKERRFAENRKHFEERQKEHEQLLSYPLKSLIPKEGIRRRDSEGNSSVTYPSLDGSDAIITDYNNADGS